MAGFGDEEGFGYATQINHGDSDCSSSATTSITHLVFGIEQRQVSLWICGYNFFIVFNLYPYNHHYNHISTHGKHNYHILNHSPNRPQPNNTPPPPPPPHPTPPPPPTPPPRHPTPSAAGTRDPHTPRSLDARHGPQRTLPE